MLEAIEFSNVRLFDGPQEWLVPLAPLSVFCGTNSSGKSTILKSLLLLCQSNLETGGRAPDGRITFSGPLVDLGSYRSFVSHNDLDRDMLLGVTISEQIEFRYVRRLLKARADATSSFSNVPSDQDMPYLLRSQFRCGIPHWEEEEPTLFPDLAGTKRRPGVQQAYLKEAAFSLRIAGEVELSWSVALNQTSKAYDIFMPADYFGMTRGFEVTGVLKDETAKQVRIESLMRGLLPIGLWAPGKRGRRQDVEGGTEDWSFFPLPPLIRECCQDLAQDLATVHYLGPLRSPAKRFYMTNLDVIPAMDAAGDFLPYVLRDQRNQKIYYSPPNQPNHIAEEPLENALNEWMHYLRTGRVQKGIGAAGDAHEIDVGSTKDVLLEFTLKSFGGEAHALADSGFGYSQILPIVVRGLIAEPASTIVIEQPEVHLNPALQVRLAEFLLSLTRTSKKVLVETHSEHIVNAIRVLAAEDQTRQSAGSCRILFLETESGMPQMQRLEVQPDGTIPEWPRHFFGEALSLSARLLRAQRAARKPE